MDKGRETHVGQAMNPFNIFRPMNTKEIVQVNGLPKSRIKVSRTVVAVERPSFNMWAKYVHGK